MGYLYTTRLLLRVRLGPASRGGRGVTATSWALLSLALNADNQVAIAKTEGALAALVALLRDGSAVGKDCR